jgi:hypothetical protein
LNQGFFVSFTFNFWRNIMNNIIKLGFVITVALSSVACGDKTPPAQTPAAQPPAAQPQTSNPAAQPPAAVQPQTSNPVAQPPAAVQPQTSNPIAQPALDATDKAKQVEGVMKKEEATQKQAIDAK